MLGSYFFCSVYAFFSGFRLDCLWAIFTPHPLWYVADIFWDSAKVTLLSLEVPPQTLLPP